VSIEWQAPEFEHRQKNVSWYWLSLLVSIILLALSVWQKNFLFAVFIIIAWFVIIYSTSRLPTIWNFKLSEKGIEINLPESDASSNKFYPINEIEGFDIHSTAQTNTDFTQTNTDTKKSLYQSVSSPSESMLEYKELILKIKKRFSPYLKINFPATDQEKITEFLQKYISKQEYSESLADSFSKLIGF